jgi:hypothetical protein
MDRGALVFANEIPKWQQTPKNFALIFDILKQQDA